MHIICCDIEGLKCERITGHICWLMTWIHKNPYKHRFIAGSSKCSTKPFSILLTKLLIHIKQGLQTYCETAYSRSGINRMWILGVQRNCWIIWDLQFQPRHKHQVLRFFDPLHSRYPPEGRRRAGNYYKELLHSQKWKPEIQIFGFGSRGALFCELTLWFEEQVHWRRHKDARVSSWQHFAVFAGKVFQQSTF